MSAFTLDPQTRQMALAAGSGIAQVRIDTSGLSAVTETARLYSNRTPAVAANTAAYRVARRAQELTPAATMAKIDSSLGATTTPVLSTKGKRKGLPLLRRKNNVTVTEGGPATKIVLARMNPRSAYNRLTGWYWAIDREKFSPGGGQAGFWRKVYDTAVRMVKARHSSTHYLKAGWNPAIRVLKETGLISKSAFRGFSAPGFKRRKDIEAGYAVPAREGVITRCEVGNTVGMDGSNAILNDKHNRALHQYAGPALQKAIAIEFDQTCEYIAKEEARRAFGALRGKGVILEA